MNEKTKHLIRRFKKHIIVAAPPESNYSLLQGESPRIKKVLSIDELHHDANWPCTWNSATGKRNSTRGFHLVQFCQDERFMYASQYFILHSNPQLKEWSTPCKEFYTEFPLLYIDEQTGYVEKRFLYFKYFDDINNNCALIATHFDDLHLTPELLQYLYKKIQYNLKGAHCFDVPRHKLMAVLQPTIDLVSNAIKTGENIFSQIKIDLEAIDQLKGRF